MDTSGGVVGFSRLLNLPPELLNQIIESLIPEPPELGETRPVSYDKLAPGELWYDITRGRHGLRSLSLTCRGLRAIAQPLLYRVVSLLDDEAMVLLFRTLTERPDLGAHNRYLSCHLTLTRTAVIKDTKRTIIRLITTFRPDFPSLERDHPDVMEALKALIGVLPLESCAPEEYDDFPQMLLFYMASLMKNMETFLLQAPICDDHTDYTALFEKFAALNLSWKTSPNHDPQNKTTGQKSAVDPKRPFQHVKTLLLQGDPELLDHFEGDSCDCDIPDYWGVQARRYWAIFNALPSLTTLEVSADDGIWNNTRHRGRDGNRPSYLERVEHLYLHNSFASPRALNHVLVNSPALETLYMTPRRYDDLFLDEEAEGMDVHPEALDLALLKNPKQLRHLDIGWMTCAGNEAFIGDGGRLTSLPQLTNLENLCIQLTVLYGTDPANLLTPMVDLLPPSLVELTLEEWWWEDLDTYEEMEIWSPGTKTEYYQSKSEYRAQALAILSRFAMDCERRMGKLRKVTFQIKVTCNWMIEGFVSSESHFHEVKSLFGKRGIRFLVDEV